MNILPLSNYQSTQFKAANNQLIKRIIDGPNKYTVPQIKENSPVKKVINPVVKAADVDGILRMKGITHCNKDGDFVSIIAGYNGGFYKIKTGLNATLLQAKVFVNELLNRNTPLLCGLANYKDMVADIKRQDLIQKGLGLRTNELNLNVSEEYADDGAYDLTRHLKYGVPVRNLFFIDQEAFYYDAESKTAYGVNIYEKRTPTTVVSTCKFITDKRGNAVGYTTNNYNIYYNRPVEETYLEQQMPSAKLPQIADSANNKLYAEAFRFGNTEKNHRFENASSNVLNHLSNIVKIPKVSKDDLQFIRFYDKDKNIVSRIGFYDSSTGLSLIYNMEGKYMYQLEYAKDDFGNILSCLRF